MPRRGDVWSSVMKVSQPLRHQVREAAGAHSREYSDQSINQSVYNSNNVFGGVRNDAHPRHRPTRNATPPSGMPSAAKGRHRESSNSPKARPAGRPLPITLVDPLSAAPASPRSPRSPSALRRPPPVCTPPSSAAYSSAALSRNKPFGLAQGASQYIELSPDMLQAPVDAYAVSRSGRRPSREGHLFGGGFARSESPEPRVVDVTRQTSSASSTADVLSAAAAAQEEHSPSPPMQRRHSPSELARAWSTSPTALAAGTPYSSMPSGAPSGFLSFKEAGSQFIEFMPPKGAGAARGVATHS